MKPLFFLALLLMFLPYRLLFITDPLRHVNQFRQAQTATVALNFYYHGITPWRTELNIFGMGKERYLTLEFPLYESLISVLYHLFFISDLWGRVISVLAGAIGGWYLYLLVLLLTGKRYLSWFSAFFFFLAPINMFYQRDILIEPTIIATLLAGLYYGCLWVNNRRLLTWLVAVALLSLGFVQKGMYGPFWLPVIGIYALSQPKKKRSLFALAGLCFIPIVILFLWQHHVNVQNTANGQGYFSTNNLGHLDWNFGTWADRLSRPLWEFRLRNLLNGIFLKPGLVLFLLGLVTQAGKKQMRIFYFWLLSEVAYYLLLFRIQSHINYEMVLVPVCSFFMAAGFLWFIRFVGRLGGVRASKRTIKLVVVIICSFLLFRSAASSRWDNEDDKNWYQRLQQVGQAVPKQSWGILVNPGGDWNSVYTYFTHLHLKEAPAETVTEAAVAQWQQEGYTYIILHEYSAYPGHSLLFLDRYKEVLKLEDFRILLL